MAKRRVANAWLIANTTMLLLVSMILSISFIFNSFNYNTMNDGFTCDSSNCVNTECTRSACLHDECVEVMRFAGCLSDGISSNRSSGLNYTFGTVCANQIIPCQS
jgi:hypothetical protein